VTGGIGGVHRGGESSLDISADLTELGRTPVAVVCAGAKSVLDIPRTLEFLETQGVTVAAYQCAPPRYHPTPPTG
jgi:pseudouridine-5'-phosphate glycosidase